MNQVSILLSTYGHFNLHPELLKQLRVPITNDYIRIDQSLINLFNLYGNQIAQNCQLRIEKIPYDIFSTKEIKIHKNIYGKEEIGVYEKDGDVVMRYW